MSDQRMRDRITIRQDSSADGDVTLDFSGQPKYQRIPAKITAVGGSESLRGRQIEATIDYLVEIRRRTGIKPTMRVDVDCGPFAGQSMNIEKILPAWREGRRTARGKIELHCTELVT